jgi:hypothetical protein
MLRRLALAIALAEPAVLLGANPTQITASPATVSFLSSDPDAGPVAGSPVTVTWVVWLGGSSNTWNVTVRANSSTLGSCAAVPASAIRARCTSVSVTGFPAGSGSCSQAFPLGTGDQQIAGGLQGGIYATYTVTITYDFTDSWRYKGATAPACSLNLTYVVNIQ